MVVTRDGVNGVYQVIDISDPAAPVVVYDMEDAKRMTFHSLSPDGQYILGVESGSLKLYDLATNSFLGAVTPDGNRYSHPGWAPDGKHAIAVRVTESFRSDMTFTGGEIVTMSWDGSRLGTPEVLVARSASANFYYPTWSPDGEWVVFNRSTGDAYADADAELWMVAATGGEPVRLDNANGSTTVLNSLARWAPLPDDDVLWLAFSSRQPITADQQVAPQIWVTAVEPELLRAGLDPSSAPYWLPGQNVRSDSHLPVWWSQ
jgi:Tol biopolymer transport system component